MLTLCATEKVSDPYDFIDVAFNVVFEGLNELVDVFLMRHRKREIPNDTKRSVG